MNALIRRMKFYSPEEVRAAYIVICKGEASKRQRGESALVEMGYEPVTCDGLLTQDGRDVIELGGKKWALTPTAHAARLAAAFEAARQARPQPDSETKSVVGTESLSEMVCPKCGDNLQHTAVCSKCSAGQRGYRHRYTCVCGAIEIISKEKL